MSILSLKYRVRFGITSKLFAWYFIFVVIFYGTIAVLYINVQQMMIISENIVNKNYKISSASKMMIENLLNMEENEKKFLLLKKEEYLKYFSSSQRSFEDNMREILMIESRGMTISPKWKEIRESFNQFSFLPENLKALESLNTLIIPEATINEWIQKISLARAENEHDVEQTNRALNRQSQFAVRSGLEGLGISIVVGFLGGMLLSHSMIRPLKELIKGIRSISHEKPSVPILIKSKDEFGELATAFNEMAFRLKEEQRMRSDFISMLSHEIRTPLTSIRESVNLIGEGIMGNINDRQRKFLEIASLEIGRVSDLLNRIMQVSCLESGVFDIKSNPIVPFDFISECIKQLVASAEVKDIIIETKISKDLPQILADPKYLQQVFINLIGNAIKFCPLGSKIILSAEADEEDPSKLKFMISDNGPGIPEEEQIFIFNKYYRAKDMRDHMDGAGLGLNIAKHIIEAHGGSIGVMSKVSIGTTFYFTIPVAMI